MNENQLSIKQEMAIDLIMAGHLDSEVAEQLGVARQTISRWRNDNPAFIEALQARRTLLREQYMQKLGELVDRAMAVLAEALESDDKTVRLRAAIVILKVSGLQGFARPARALDREDLEKSDLLATLAIALRQARDEKNKPGSGHN